MDNVLFVTEEPNVKQRSEKRTFTRYTIWD